jgi:hypothetical protein
MRTRLILVIVALLVLCGGAVSADTSYMPVARETGAGWVYVHVIACPAWPGQEAPIAGRRVTVSDGERTIIWAETTERGDAVMSAPLPDVVTVTLDTGQSVTVRRGGPVHVAFWVGRCAGEAASWERVR